jgi:hypothetical protein
MKVMETIRELRSNGLGAIASSFRGPAPVGQNLQVPVAHAGIDDSTSTHWLSRWADSLEDEFDRGED